MIMCFPVSAAYVMPSLPRPVHVEYTNDVAIITPGEVIEIVCDYYKVDRSIVFSRSRTVNTITVRRMSQYFMLKHCSMSISDIARLFKQDHTTVMFTRDYMNGQLSARGHNDTKNHIEDIFKLLPKKVK